MNIHMNINSYSYNIYIDIYNTYEYMNITCSSINNIFKD